MILKPKGTCKRLLESETCQEKEEDKK